MAGGRAHGERRASRDTRNQALDAPFSCLGLTPNGAIGATTASVRPGVIALCHGGPIAEPGDAGTVLDHTAGVAGFFGPSSTERLPTEVAITENMRRFKRITRAAAVAG